MSSVDSTNPIEGYSDITMNIVEDTSISSNIDKGKVVAVGYSNPYSDSDSLRRQINMGPFTSKYPILRIYDVGPVHTHSAIILDKGLPVISRSIQAHNISTPKSVSEIQCSQYAYMKKFISAITPEP